MCGICGEVRFDGRMASPERIERMGNCLARRGPDGSGQVVRGNVGFGHRRLKIIDLSEKAQQPMVDADLGLTLAFNGCIYNYPALRAELLDMGYRFFSHGDTEVIAKAYHAWGPSCVERFKGMFAFAIHERDTGRVMLARDRFGIKPLYLSQTPERLYFASSLQSILKTGDVDTSIDREALHHYMTFHAVVPAPLTIIEGVRKLPPATVRLIEPDGTFEDTVYWNPSYGPQPGDEAMTADDWRDAVLESLRTAVERRMVADVPVGVSLMAVGLMIAMFMFSLNQTVLATALPTIVGELDGVLHSIGFAPEGAFTFLDATWEDVGTAVHVSAYSLKALAVAALPRMTEGGSIVGLTFDASYAWPVYDWMGVAKAAFESTNRYLARDLGPQGIRCNLVAAGPIRTTAAKSIPGFEQFEETWNNRAPLGWDVSDAVPAARACAALLSDWFPATTGEIVHVDGGVHAMGQ